MLTETKEVNIKSYKETSENKSVLILEESAELPTGEIILYQLTGTEMLTEFEDETLKTATSYSIIVTKFTKNQNAQFDSLESSSANDFTRETQQAFDFFSTVSKNTVTPITLEYIIEDWLGEWEF